MRTQTRFLICNMTSYSALDFAKYCQPVCVCVVLNLSQNMDSTSCQKNARLFCSSLSIWCLYICHTAFSRAHPLCSSFIYVFIFQGQPLILSEACICTQWLESHLSGQLAQAPSFFDGLV